MHAILTNQIIDIWHFSDNYYYKLSKNTTLEENLL